MSIFGKPSGIIRNRIMEVIEEKIEGAEDEYNDKCENLEEKYTGDMELLSRNLDRNKSKVADELVSDILGKVA